MKKHCSGAVLVVAASIFGLAGCAGGPAAPEDPEKFRYISDSYFAGDTAACRSEKVKRYAGSEACKSCHQPQHASWRKSYMSRFVRLASDARHVPSFSSLPNTYRDKRNDVAIVVGGRRHMAVVLTPWQVLPYQYQLKWRGKKSRHWKPRPEWGYVSDYRKYCGECHLTGLDAVTLEFSELGVGCEACHGPGKAHVTASGAGAITRPDGQRVCERCHFKRYKHTVRFKYPEVFHR